MQLTKTQEAEILKAYGIYFDSYMKGDIETVASLLDDEYSQVGSAEGEVFFNKKDAVQFLYNTMHQVAGKVEMRNRVVKLEKQENTFLVHEFADLYALAGTEWIFYSKFRASTFMQNRNDAWKIIHQHSSFPDARAEDGQNLAIEKIDAENQQLREAVKRRTIELEEKNRALEIEASLERVRAVAMGMKQPADMLDVCREISDQFQQLSIKEIRNVQTAVINESKGTYQNFEYYKLHDKTIITEVDYHHHEMTTTFVNQMLSGPEELFTKSLSGRELRGWFEHQKTTNQFIDNYLETASSLNYYWYSIGPVALGVSTYLPLNETEMNLIKRFRNVFELAYRRFMDIEKAETQAKEALIELGLERVRARAMAMQKSNELAELVDTIFKELTKLHFSLNRCIIMIYDHSTNDSTWWLANPESGTAPVGVFVKYHEYPPYLAYIDAWQNKTMKWQYILEGTEKKEWDDFIFSETEMSLLPQPVIVGMKSLKRINLNASYNNFGSLTAASIEPMAEEQFDILLRFAKVFDLTYTRFNDLQKAEANATEAKIEASLERVRSKAMSMHSSQDLADTIGVFYHELELFSITPRRCGVGLINKETHVTELSTMNTTEDGRSIEIIGKIKLVGHPVLENIYNKWLLNEEYHPVLKGNEIKEYYQLLRPQIAFPDYPHDAIHYGYFFYFPEGGVYAWTDKVLAEDELKIYRRFTSVLSLTYKRYKDLKIAEAHAQQSELDLKQLKEEKQRTEEALTELKATQSQLIQSEKMASLGELTAGIAHEIQNPLNFVNNFSEVSNELIVEMNEELLKGDIEEAKVIANDILQNLEKINHHGKRAAAIVKGMLQHSRTSSATKEPTDINKLADEYLRLAYHGLRAKDKTFNATLKTEFDESIGNINIIPQDIGRVILNLITNAFYALNEKEKSVLTKASAEKYEPTVSVSTKKMNDKIELSVKDNGSGIPQKVLDKIFQPFFTTKPTGQGTGLGLSLAYDIVKANGGELKVETIEGIGSEFIISLPAS